MQDSALSSRYSNENVCLNQLCATQQPPALLQMLHERARWFHEHPTRSPFLMSLEQQALSKKND